MSFSWVVNSPADFLAHGCIGLVEVATDGASGADESVDGEVAITAKHGGDTCGTDIHAFGEFGAVDTLAFHELEELFDDDQFTKFDFRFDGGCFGEIFGERVRDFFADDVHDVDSSKTICVFGRSLMFK